MPRFSEAFTLGPKEGYRIHCEPWNHTVNVWHLPFDFGIDLRLPLSTIYYRTFPLY
jgi:hypothetical protein